MEKPIVRMYVDENGHQSLKGDLSNDNKRFLCITGVIMRLTEHVFLEQQLDALKDKHFGDKSIILHRRELISAAGVFSPLQSEDARARFNQDFLDIVEKTNYRVISAVIDKKRYVELKGFLHVKDPYALALEFLMQRYQYWMQDYKAKFGDCRGDIMAESRGGGEDRITKSTYQEIYLGRGYNSLKDADKYFSSKEIKLKPKSANIAGLQFVDLVSHPSRRYILTSNNLAPNIKKSSFEQQIVDILVASKFRRSTNGQIEGYGTVFYPK